MRQREAELADIRGRVEYDVRAALLDLRAADQQLQAAHTNMQLADAELTQARDRFGAGVASNLEITQAQESVATASEQPTSPRSTATTWPRRRWRARSASRNRRSRHYLGGAQ